MPGFLRSIDDAVRYAASKATFGAADYWANKLGFEDNAFAKTAAAKERLGGAALPIAVAANLAGPGAAFKGAKLALGGIKNVIGGAGRLVPQVARNHPFLATAAVAGAAAPEFVAAGAADTRIAPQTRTAAQSRVAALTAPRAPQSESPSGLTDYNSAGANEAEKAGTAAMAGMDPSVAPTFQQMALNLQEQQGAGLSLHQARVLADIAKDLAPAASSRPDYRETLGNSRAMDVTGEFELQKQRAAEMAKQGDMAGGRKLYNDAKTRHDRIVDQLLGVRDDDPTGIKAMQAAAAAQGR